MLHSSSNRILLSVLAIVATAQAMPYDHTEASQLLSNLSSERAVLADPWASILADD